jgi:hypothetical protein
MFPDIMGQHMEVDTMKVDGTKNDNYYCNSPPIKTTLALLPKLVLNTLYWHSPPILEGVTKYRIQHITLYWLASPCIGLYHPILENVTLYGI